MRVGARARAVIAVALVTAAAPARADDALTLAFVGDVMFGRYVPGGLAPIAAEQHDPQQCHERSQSMVEPKYCSSRSRC